MHQKLTLNVKEEQMPNGTNDSKGAAELLERIKKATADFPQRVNIFMRDDEKSLGQLLAEIRVDGLESGQAAIMERVEKELRFFEMRLIDSQEGLKAAEKDNEIKILKIRELNKTVNDFIGRIDIIIKSKAELRLSMEEEIGRVSERAKKMETATRVITAICASLRPNNKKSDFIAKLEEVKNILSNI